MAHKRIKGRRRGWAAAVLAALSATPAVAAISDACGPAERTPVTAVMTAFEPESVALRAMISDPQPCRIKGVAFVRGRIEGRAVVVFQSGVSMVNAAMTTQLALDHFNISRIVMSGVGGGADPGLAIGDVVVPQRWAQYLEAGYGRAKDGGFAVPPFHHGEPLPSYGMIFPNPVLVGAEGGPVQAKFWFEVDPLLMDVARKVAGSATLSACSPKGDCLDHAPRVVVGGAGVSGPVFVDNAEFRSFAHTAFAARVLDMETAAVAHVAYANGTPFIAFRSLSDLAGGDASANRVYTFLSLAARNSAAFMQVFLRALPAD